MGTRTLVLGYDGSEGAKVALEWCRAYAPDLGAEVVVVGAVNIVPLIGLAPAGAPTAGMSMDGMVAAAEDVVGEAAKLLHDDGTPCRTVVEIAHPAELLDRVARDEAADLIVVGRRGHGGFAEMLLGSIPHSLSHHASRPLVIVPTAG